MKKLSLKNIDFTKLNGLVPAIIQNAANKDVLMLGFMNQEALRKTLRTKRVIFWSRSKKRLWQKGEESKNFLNVVSVYQDCDKDTLLILANPAGPTCHNGEYSCFSIPKNESLTVTLDSLYQTIESRENNLPINSYTASLFRAGLDRIVQKVGEEATEVVIAGKNNSTQRLVEESCDLLYHLLVLLVAKKIGLKKITQELAKRKAV